MRSIARPLMVLGGITGGVIAAVLVATGAGATTAPAGGTSHETCAAAMSTIRALPEQRIAAAWKDNDAGAFAAQFTRDATFVVPDDVYLKSRDQIRAYMTKNFAGPLKGAKATAQVINARCVSRDVAVLVTTGGIVFPGETEPPADRIGVQTWTIVRTGGHWLATAYENARGVDLDPPF